MYKQSHHNQQISTHNTISKFRNRIKDKINDTMDHKIMTDSKSCDSALERGPSPSENIVNVSFLLSFPFLHLISN